MKALIKINGQYLIIIISLLLSSQIYSQDRNTGWVHGLGENAATWDIYHNLFDMERQMTGISEGYPSFGGVAPAATNVTGDMEAAFEFGGSTDAQNMGIGHSMGGIVIREIDRTETGTNQRFGGLITVGSPNHGARILNSIENGDVDEVMDDACRRLSAGPLSEIPVLLYNIGGIGSSALCNLLREELIEPNIGADNFNEPSHIDLREESNFLTTLNNTSPNVPLISIWGNENSPVHWRLASSFTSGNMNDTEIVDAVNQIRTLYNAMFIFNTSRAIITGLLGIANPVAWIKTGINVWQASQWLKGRKWIDDSETLWNGLIGCIREETTSFPAGGDCSCYSILTEDWNECMYGSGMICPEYTATQTIIARYPSDGLLCEYTQIYEDSHDVFEALGVNHSDEVNTTAGNTQDGNDEMGDIFNLIWDSENSFFQTPVR